MSVTVLLYVFISELQLDSSAHMFQLSGCFCTFGFDVNGFAKFQNDDWNLVLKATKLHSVFLVK